MAGGNSTADSDFHCSDEFLAAFRKSMRGQVWRVNAMLLTDVVLAGVIVAMGAYGQRYRHHPFTRFVFLGATTLFLPILSYVVSSTDSKSNSYSNVTEGFGYFHGLVATCEGKFHSPATVTWAFLVQIVVINTSTEQCFQPGTVFFSHTNQPAVLPHEPATNKPTVPNRL